MCDAFKVDEGNGFDMSAIAKISAWWSVGDMSAE